ncbi:MAG: tRNA pseudouridine(38-40) synthase TruA [Chloroflexi bacterium]|nr:tRNA pseudouridine(38-40) synthase TruA [Chloroflexota bacterium]
MTRFRALVEYDGTAYFGFQRQIAGQPTIQSQLEQALSQIVRQEIVITGAGRTDSGVHAIGQVISFDSEWRHSPTALQRALNANLPADIAILQLDSAEPNFHPRFDAQRRAYHYHIYNAPLRSPLRRQRSWHVAKPLDWQRMNQAAACLIGIHDFATFGQPPQGDVTIREIFEARWEWQNEFLVFRIEADAFLYRMVRSIVGSLKAVGEGNWTVEAFAAALAACDRSRSGKVAPAQGLTLVSVTYGE